MHCHYTIYSTNTCHRRFLFQNDSFKYVQATCILNWSIVSKINSKSSTQAVYVHIQRSWLVSYLLVTFAGSNGGGDHPIPAVVRRYCCYWCGKLFFTFSGATCTYKTQCTSNVVIPISSFAYGMLSYFLAPFIGWLADVKFGRYEYC